jgi:hypothetical protein
LHIFKIPLYTEFLQFMKTAKLLQFCKLLKLPSIGVFLQFIKTAKLLQFCKLKFIKTAKLLQFCKLVKFPSIGNFAIYKHGQIIAIKQIAIYKNGQIIAIISNININGFYFRIYNPDPSLHIPDYSHIGTAGRK